MPEAEKLWPQRVSWTPRLDLRAPGKRGRRPSGPARAGADTRDHLSDNSEVKARSRRHGNGWPQQPLRERKLSAETACSPEPLPELLRQAPALGSLASDTDEAAPSGQRGPVWDPAHQPPALSKSRDWLRYSQRTGISEASAMEPCCAETCTAPPGGQAVPQQRHHVIFLFFFFLLEKVKGHSFIYSTGVYLRPRSGNTHKKDMIHDLKKLSLAEYCLVLKNSSDLSYLCSCDFRNNINPSEPPFPLMCKGNNTYSTECCEG